MNIFKNKLQIFSFKVYIFNKYIKIIIF
ncbi:hypothetical protein PVSEL_API_0100190 (apicoplast) [Plasmodium vinckei]|uniref:Uncharacterized protein n=1 Tax=Plasmodium vinckei TaxID=5860 RepID=A0A6V7TGY3_PLAVN|nr:hypothetical protein PVSEL_API_0100190 [Plasmodium vinckei]